MPVATLKGTIQGHTSILSENQRLIYAGQELKDNKILRDYGVNVGMTVHCAQRGTPVNLAIVENSLQEMQTKLENERQQKEKEKATKNQIVFSGSDISNEKEGVIDLEMKDNKDLKGGDRNSKREHTNKTFYATSLKDSVIEDGRDISNENVNNNQKDVERSNKRKRKNLTDNDPDMKKNVEIIIDEDNEDNINNNNCSSKGSGNTNTKAIDRRSGSISSATSMPIYSNGIRPQAMGVNSGLPNGP